MLKYILITIILPSILTFCGSNKNSSKEIIEVPDAGESEPRKEMAAKSFRNQQSLLAPGRSDQSGRPISEIGEKIIREGNLHYQVKNWEEAKKYAEAEIEKYDGYISNENQSNNPDRIMVDLTIRVPNKHFDSLVAALTQSAHILKLEHKSINARDVTEEYIDIQTRLENKREVEQRYRELLAQATRVEDIVNIEEKLATVREEIESIEARLEYLNDKVAYSTLNLHFYEKLPFQYTPRAQDNFGARFVQALHDGWRALISGILFLFSVWPYVILIVLGVYGYRWYKRR